MLTPAEIPPGTPVQTVNQSDMIILRLEADGIHAICSWRVGPTTYSALFAIDELSLAPPGSPAS